MLHIILYQPEIPQNCGNILRTAVSCGAKVHLIHPLGFRLDATELKRAGMDYLLDADIEEYASVEAFFETHDQKQIYYISRYGRKKYTDIDVSNPAEDIYFMFGKESTGLPYTLLQQHLDRCLRIPMKVHARSLNVSNCVAIVVYEALRQQDFFLLSTEETFKGYDYLKED